MLVVANANISIYTIIRSQICLHGNQGESLKFTASSSVLFNSGSEPGRWVQVLYLQEAEGVGDVELHLHLPGFWVRTAVELDQVLGLIGGTHLYEGLRKHSGR